MRAYFSRLFSVFGHWGWLVGVVLLTGCSSSSNPSHPTTILTLTEIRQSSNGELALVYDEQKAQQTGQRLYIVDPNALGKNLQTALNEIQTHPGYGETFSGAVVMHRRFSNDTFGQDSFWVELDPYQLPGAWLPAATLPPLPPSAVAQTLPASFQVYAGLAPDNALASPLNSTSPVIPPVTFAISPARPNEHFIWRSPAGPLDTAISQQPLIQKSNHRKFWDKAEAFADGTITVLTVVAAVGVEFAIECVPYREHASAFHR
ncbi:MAG TPA: hypothetical protein VK737_10435 [Opitutales bacterium]|jgi:hypothetical protein|nr:hypothetical protein [Opitutales bacterium]